jgi:arabinan endo-1,5-alpha-L-arabinosidase
MSVCVGYRCVRPLFFGSVALAALSALFLMVAAGCGAVIRPVAANYSLSPVFSHYKLTGSVELVRDPSIIRQGNTFYVFSTDDGVPVGGSIRIRCSDNLDAWTECGHVFDGVPAWVSQALPGVAGLWAPDISYFNNEYHLYYVGSIFGTNRSVIGLATNASLDPHDPNYAWMDRGEVLRSGPDDNFNALDPNIVQDADGSVWLTYGSFWTGIRQAGVDPLTGMLLASGKRYSLAARPSSSPHAVEAPFVIRHGNYYYLFVSFGLCCSSDPYHSDYRMMFGRATSLHGPFFDMNGIPMLQGGGSELLAGSNTGWNAPGGQSLFTDPTSGLTTIVFHSHKLPAGTPYLFVNTLSWNNDWPQIQP